MRSIIMTKMPKVLFERNGYGERWRIQICIIKIRNKSSVRIARWKAQASGEELICPGVSRLSSSSLVRP